MKKLYFLMVVVAFSLSFTSCGNSKKQSEESATAQVSSKMDVAKAMYVEEILQHAEQEVGKEILLKGFVTHTCKHSGRRCFVMGNDQ